MKFKLSEKVKYMIFGALLTLSGFIVGNLNNGIEAQSGSDTIDKLTVRELTVLEDLIVRNEDGDIVVLIDSSDGNGRITIRDKQAKGVIIFGFQAQGGGPIGAITADKNSTEKSSILMSVIQGQGLISVTDSEGNTEHLRP